MLPCWCCWCCSCFSMPIYLVQDYYLSTLNMRHCKHTYIPPLCIYRTRFLVAGIFSLCTFALSLSHSLPLSLSPSLPLSLSPSLPLSLSHTSHTSRNYPLSVCVQVLLIKPEWNCAPVSLRWGYYYSHYTPSQSIARGDLPPPTSPLLLLLNVAYLLA